MKINLGNVNLDRNVEAGDIIITKSKGMNNVEVYLLSAINGDWLAVSLDGVGTLNGAWSSAEKLIDDIRSESLVDTIKILSQEEYKLSVERVQV